MMARTRSTRRAARSLIFISHRRGTASVSDYGNRGAGQVVGGAVALGNGVENGSVTGLALAAAPAAVVLTVQSPSGGQVLWGELVGAPTPDGFAWQLNGRTDATTYKLHYAIVL